jgi:hypothetical protein
LMGCWGAGVLGGPLGIDLGEEVECVLVLMYVWGFWVGVRMPCCAADAFKQLLEGAGSAGKRG